MIKLFHKIFTATSNSVRTQNIELGRWSLVYEPKIIHNKVDQANEGQNVIHETCKTHDDEYILPYIMESMPHK
jgi:hypothetical protein